jgi:hypothetical protein
MDTGPVLIVPRSTPLLGDSRLVRKVLGLLGGGSAGDGGDGVLLVRLVSYIHEQRSAQWR